jgi:hypothetical protein
MPSPGVDVMKKWAQRFKHFLRIEYAGQIAGRLWFDNGKCAVCLDMSVYSQNQLLRLSQDLRLDLSEADLGQEKKHIFF